MSERFQKFVLKWLANGDTGVSSETMAFRMLGIKRRRIDEYHPSDPDDLNRCIKFLHEVPGARRKLNMIRKVSPVWNAIIDHWSDLEQMFIDEVGYDWSKSKRAPKTYDRMKKIIDLI